MKAGKISPKVVIGLGRLPELNFIEVDSGIRIGPLTSMSQIAHHPKFSGRLSILREAALAVGDGRVEILPR